MSCRIYDGYTINDSIHIGGTEFVIGHNPKSVLPYVVWECFFFLSCFALLGIEKIEHLH